MQQQTIRKLNTKNSGLLSDLFPIPNRIFLLRREYAIFNNPQSTENPSNARS